MPAYIPDNRSLPQPRVIMSCIVRRRHIQSEVGEGAALPPHADGGFWYRAEYPSGPFASHDRSPSSPSRAIVSSMLDDMRLPFPLDQMGWLDVSAGTYLIKCLTRDELVSEIARATSHAVNDTCSEGRKRTKMVLSIVHIAISEHEMQARWPRFQWRIMHSRILWRRLISGQRSALSLTRQEGAVTTHDRNAENVSRTRVMRESMDHTLVFVFAMPAYIPDNQSLPQPQVIMSRIVRRRYVQSEVGGGTALPPRASDGGFLYRAEYPSGPFASHDRSPSSQSRAIVSSMLDDMRLSIPLDQPWWLDVSVGTHVAKKCLTRDELVSDITRATSRAVNDTRNEGRKRTMMLVGIVQIMRESMDQESINFGAAHESMIESLNKVAFEGDQGSTSSHCVNCVEDVGIGG
ncbi:hypothetical protein ACJRO7_032193 [Eucalyptus globulus]|uniref:Uncharacterized protein n=1 Tax=Eucalyptus globulus TaxID=34317 RepID=A0ABD3JM60_EUCGL